MPMLPPRPDHRRGGVRLLGGQPDRRQAGKGRILRVCGRVHAEEQVED